MDMETSTNDGVTLVATAKRIATAAHDGQVDKSGAPYIDHPRRVANRLPGDDLAQAVAWLHDVIEDTHVKQLHLLAQGIPVEVVAAVDAITRRRGEAPDDYYARVKQNPLALKVKMADIEDNSSPLRLVLLPPETADRLRLKYRHAIEILGQE